MDIEQDNNQWLGVIGRSLAFLCLSHAELRDKDLATQAIFLEGFGLARLDIANLLDTTPKTLRDVLSRARRGKRGKHGKAKKKS